MRVPPIGTLTDRIQLRGRHTVREDDGGAATVFVPLASVWGRVRSLSARQNQQGDGKGVSASHSVVLRFRSDIKPGDRIGWRGRTLEVLSAEDINGRRAYLGCACAETGFAG